MKLWTEATVVTTKVRRFELSSFIRVQFDFRFFIVFLSNFSLNGWMTAGYSDFVYQTCYRLLFLDSDFLAGCHKETIDLFFLLRN
jgi:hypothetical protein